jgi:hypothetical protein
MAASHAVGRREPRRSRRQDRALEALSLRSDIIVNDSDSLTAPSARAQTGRVVRLRGRARGHRARWPWRSISSECVGHSELMGRKLAVVCWLVLRPLGLGWDGEVVVRR